MKKFTKLAVTLVAPLALTFASSAQAELITDWGFALDTGFVNYTPTSGVTGSNDNAFYSAPTTLSWGASTGLGQSSLDISGTTNDGRFVGGFQTNGAAADITTLTHNNNPITGTTLLTATLNTQLVLTPSGLGSIAAIPLNFDILFEETPNEDSLGQCISGSVSLCDDIFVVSAEGVLFDEGAGSLHKSFEFGGQAYDLEMAISGLGVLNAEQCAAANAAENCIGFTTLEAQSNHFDVTLAISTDIFEVSAPSTVALFSLSLLGLAGMSRKKSA